MVATWVKQLTEEAIGGSTLKVGDIVRHPDGRRVKIVDGQYWGEHGLSNFWYWQEVKDDESLSEKKESGYGWVVEPEPKRRGNV